MDQELVSSVDHYNISHVIVIQVAFHQVVIGTGEDQEVAAEVVIVIEEIVPEIVVHREDVVAPEVALHVEEAAVIRRIKFVFRVFV